FTAIVEEVKLAINEGINPTRIKQGSSGSYFCYNRKKEIVGIFKPKNEEPYGKNNPKWTKWIQRNLFPCFFGRGCLVPNLGYISEAAASYIDRRLHLNIVPRTEIVSLSSPSFYYNSKELQDYYDGKSSLPKKKGSFQLFMTGYKDANIFFKEGYDQIIKNNSPMSNESSRSNLHSLLVLDYLIRNTDRGLDNWLIKYEEIPESNTENQSLEVLNLFAAIDNGLAFPYKHPDEWRSYPYGWAFLPISQIPFSAETRSLLPLLTSNSWWIETFKGLEQLFRIDPDFDEKMWKNQKAVMRGQGYNLIEVLNRSVLNTVD
ncbi:hypothetical protein PIROE2DRAFT_22345, partial [Piromyces sp. E2]